MCNTKVKDPKKKATDFVLPDATFASQPSRQGDVA